jgi:hypothetical protein
MPESFISQQKKTRQFQTSSQTNVSLEQCEDDYDNKNYMYDVTDKYTSVRRNPDKVLISRYRTYGT